jgi:Zinc finger, C2H2 type
MTTRKVYRMKVENKPFVCKKCNRGFTQDRYLQNHLIKKVPCDKKIECPKCKRTFKNKSSLTSHLNRITSCVLEEIPVIDSTIDEFRCHYCNKTLASAYSLKRHLTLCDKEKSMKHLLEMLEDKERIIQLQNQLMSGGIVPVATTINNNTINNIQNNMYVNVTICSFGTEDLSRLDTGKVMNLLKNNVGDFIPKMIEHVHSNPDMPEFHNVFYDPEKGKAIVFAPVSDNEQSWQMREFQEVSDELTRKIKEHIRPGAGPYFDLAAQAKDYETSNNIVQIGNRKWDDVTEQNQDVLAKVSKNKGFIELVAL